METTPNLPLISVIIPAFNSENTIERACRSVLEQSYSNAELVVVDDGSADNTAQIVRDLSYEDNRIKLISQENYGVCKARNVGMDHAEGDYLFFLDSDDELTSDALDKMYHMAVQYQAEVVTGGFMNVFPDGKEWPDSYGLEQPVVWENTEFLSHSLADHMATHSACAKLYRSTLAKNVQFVEGRRIHEDGFYVFEIALQQPKTVVVDLPVIRRYFRKMVPGQIVYSEKLYDMLYFGKRKYQIVSERFPQMLPQAKNIVVKAALATLNTIRLVDDSRVNDLETDCIDIIREYAEAFIPASFKDKITFWVARMGLYRLYKYVYNIYLTIRK